DYYCQVWDMISGHWVF
nr:immunoglobulin light chain junction region [Macaca mulatta]MOX69064.1 immunoglobulin light chain junction region [Macaca mulatta]MOX69126.1 immunoglobulin light chain junction region [Macaca mulatta]MOX69140.1 immunoglobulin light chain junction region [Macaca mulatta]MOX69144.1 immunoglobulin light chain junction region [Macaca mulatta]